MTALYIILALWTGAAFGYGLAQLMAMGADSQ
jgi:hypothetical protein